MNLHTLVFEMGLMMMQTSSSANYSNVLNFLNKQLEIWTPAITRHTDLRTHILETRINGRSLEQTFGHESVTRFPYNDARRNETRRN